MSICTWSDPGPIQCNAAAVHDQVARSGQVWARLCERHHHALRQAVEGKDARLMLSYWVRAQGGSRVAVDRMQPEVEAGARLLTILNQARKL